MEVVAPSLREPVTGPGAASHSASVVAALAVVVAGVTVVLARVLVA